MENLIFLLVFVSIILFSISSYFYFQSHQERKEIIKRMDEFGESTTLDTDKKESWINKKILPHFEKIGNLLTARKEGDQSHLRLLFLRAGYRRENAPIIFFGIKGFLAAAFVIVVFILRFAVIKTILPLHFTVLCAVSALIGFYLPNLWLIIKTLDRKERIQKGLPDALDLMVVCVEAGAGLDAAITRIGEEMQLDNKALSDEFKLLSLEFRAGKSRKDALNNFAQRADLDDVSNLVSLLIQTERFGTSIAQALRVHSDFMRVKRYQKAEEIAAKMPLKLIFPLVFFIFPLFMLIAAGPAVLGIYRTFTGQ